MSASKVQWPELSQLSLCSEFDKENLMEFSLISLLLIHFTTVAMRLLSHGPHVTLVMWPVMWQSVTPLWHCDKVMWYFPVLYLVVISPIRKEKKRKININNDLAVLPSHDTEWDIASSRACDFIIDIDKLQGMLKREITKAQQQYQPSTNSC